MIMNQIKTTDGKRKRDKLDSQAQRRRVNKNPMYISAGLGALAATTPLSETPYTGVDSMTRNTTLSDCHLGMGYSAGRMPLLTDGYTLDWSMVTSTDLLAIPDVNSQVPNLISEQRPEAIGFVHQQ